MLAQVPTDYEACGDCGFDHDYESAEAARWHNDNPGSYGVQVIRGDYREVTRRWPSDSVPLVVTDPPYGEITKEPWDVAAYDTLQEHLERLLRPGGTAYVWGGIGKPGNRPFFTWLSRLEQNGVLTLYDVITWKKRRAYGKSDAYLFTREECAMLAKGSKPSTFHVPLLNEKRGYAGFNAKYPAKSEFLRRSNVWADITELFKGKIHPTEKPSSLAEVMIATSSNPNDSVVDLFAGSGSTGVAARKLWRRVVLVEKSDCPMHVGMVTG
jgi:site-specific DNA-methyltransferase (adenine-specific)